MMSKYRQTLQTYFAADEKWCAHTVWTSLDLLGICGGRLASLSMSLFVDLTVSSHIFSGFTNALSFSLLSVLFLSIHLSLSLVFLSVSLPYCTSKSMETVAEPNWSFRPAIKRHAECPSVYHAPIDASSAYRKSRVCKTLNTSKFTRSCILVAHSPLHTGTKLRCWRNNLYAQVDRFRWDFPDTSL